MTATGRRRHRHLKARLKATWMTGTTTTSRGSWSRAPSNSWIGSVAARGRCSTSRADPARSALVAARRGLEGGAATSRPTRFSPRAAARHRKACRDVRRRRFGGAALRGRRFDIVASMFGAMFAPRPELVARELMRVCKPGGRVAMANWTKEGFIGQMFQTFARFIAPPGMPSPLLWGDEAAVRERFGSAVSNLRLTRVNYRFDYAFSPERSSSFSASTTGRRRAPSRRCRTRSGRRCGVN